MPDATLLDDLPFRLPVPSSPLARRVLKPNFVRAAVERALALPQLEEIYTGVSMASDPCAFATMALSSLGVSVEVTPDDTARIPATGPLILVANHPFGALEGLILLSVVGAIRADVKLVANRWLAQIPPLRPALLGVDVFGADNAIRENARVFRASIEHLERQGVVMIFPAGAVSRLALRDREVRDGAWSASAVRMAIRTGSPVLPAWFSGRNSAWFQMVGVVHPHLSAAMLPRELLKKRGESIQLAFGSLIRAAELDGLDDDGARVDHVRLRAAVLGEREASTPRAPVPDHSRVPPVRRPEPRRILEEIEALPPDRILARSTDLDAVLARASEIPDTLSEIGRLREITFRAVGEGTGHECDLDAFDDTYRHLVLWDRARRCVAGAYRIGATDEILPKFGPVGMYTHSLFDWEEGAFASLGTALELGRSFVVPEYQRSFAALTTLWRGIGCHVARNPRYTTLFGPASISSAYSPLARQLIAQHLEQAHAAPEWTGRVHAKNPLVGRKVDGMDRGRLRRALGRAIDVDALVSDVEGTKRGLPVLLREYLRLGGKVLATSVDPDFNDALDALVVVDLRETDRRLLDRYFGRDAAATFLAAQRVTASKSP